MAILGEQPQEVVYSPEWASVRTTLLLANLTGRAVRHDRGGGFDLLMSRVTSMAWGYRHACWENVCVLWGE